MKKLNVKLIKSGGENDVITRLIANYNEGNEKAFISPRDLEGYLNTRNAVYPSIHNFKLVTDQSEQNTYHISEDGGETFTMSLEWAEMEELKNDIPEQLFKTSESENANYNMDFDKPSSIFNR